MGSMPSRPAPKRFQPHGLARWISKFGVLSRTEAERCVRAGRVLLNGKKMLDPDRPCHPGRDAIRLDGAPLRPAKKVYLALHKPAGYITTARDPEGRPTVYDLLPRDAARAQAVGRLDADTSGLLLFTNDTSFAARVTDGAGGVEKVYAARVAGKVSSETARRLETGIPLDGKPTQPARCRVLAVDEKSTQVEVTITEGRNRQVRRMWEALGHPVIELQRIRIGPIELGGLPEGRTRPLTEYERVRLTIDQ